MKSQTNIQWHIGIDEVGRGPIAGPVTVGIFAVQVDALEEKKVRDVLQNVKDSKQLTEKQREKIFRDIQILTRRRKDLWYRTVSIAAQDIDRRGIAACIRTAIRRGLSKTVDNPEYVSIKLDGGLRAPERFIHQETIIKGDQLNALISAASIVAKVTRDRYMIRMNSVFPNYGFAQHKGYGTKQHYKAIKKNGVCDLHRTTWIT
jgi:ribonuclease HII